MKTTNLHFRRKKHNIWARFKDLIYAIRSILMTSWNRNKKGHFAPPEKFNGVERSTCHRYGTHYELEEVLEQSTRFMWHAKGHDFYVVQYYYVVMGFYWCGVWVFCSKGRRGGQYRLAIRT